MEKFERYRFKTPMDAWAALDRLARGGIPRESMQHLLTEIIIRDPQATSRRLIVETLRILRGVPSREPGAVDPSAYAGAPSVKLFFRSREAASDAKSAVIRLAKCREPSSVTIDHQNAIIVPAEHFAQGRPCGACLPSDSDDNLAGHTSKWREIVEVLSRAGGVTEVEMKTAVAENQASEASFEDAREQIRGLMRRVPNQLESRDYAFFKFIGKKAATSAVDHAVRSGFNHKSLSTSLSPMLAVDLGDQDHERLSEIIAKSGGRLVQREEELDELATVAASAAAGKIEITFQDQEEAKIFSDEVVAMGIPPSGVQVTEFSVVLDKPENGVFDELRRAAAGHGGQLVVGMFKKAF